jgi:beta-lactamase regulating signal transducer with metallopeptidase domain
MRVWLDCVGAVLFDATLSTIFFLSCVVLAMLGCRQPSRRILIARASLIASLAMVPIVAMAPLPRIDVIGAAIRAKLVPVQVLPTWQNDHRVHPASSQTPASPVSAAALGANPTHTRLPDGWSWVLRCMTLLFLACVTVGVAWLALGFWGVCWLLGKSRAPSPETFELYTRLISHGPSRRATPALRVSTRVEHPVVVGMIHPTILIPPGYDEPETDPELLRLSLLHEIAHAEHGDAWFGTVANLAQTVWFFLPQAWWLRSQLLIDQEFIADRSAASRYGTSSGYAASLLALADSRQGASAGVPSPQALEQISPAEPRPEKRSPLFQRVLMLLYCPFRVEPQAPRSWSWTLRITVTLASLFAACLCLRWPDPDAMARGFGGKTGLLPQRFRVTDFVAEPLSFAAGGRAVSYVMPVALPCRFKLTVEVLARQPELSRVRIAGYPLADERHAESPGIAANGPEGAESWHVVRLHRTGDEILLWVDGQQIPLSPGTEPNNRWLTFEPGPERATQFRNLLVEW